VTEDTGIGNPRAATYEKGERYFKDITQKVAGLFVEMAKADVSQLYK
jgi:creatinine amidohydrolase